MHLAGNLKRWWNENQLEHHPWLKWAIRVVFITACAFCGWVIWLAVQQAFESWPWTGGLRALTFGEMITVAVYSIAVFGGVQASLRWFLVPGIKIVGHREGRALPISNANYAVHHLEVWNLDYHWVWRPLVTRAAPEGCVIKFQYWRVHDNGALDPCFDGKWLLGRWDINPEPLVPVPMETDDGVIYLLGYPSESGFIANRRLAKLFPTEVKEHPDEQVFTVAFAIKKEDDLGFYHFNDESYRRAGWCDPNLRLGPGVYRVNVRLSGYGLLAAEKAAFRLANLGPGHSDFNLDPYPKASPK